jgi:NCS1 family nucleobase:cation symporter-1
MTTIDTHHVAHGGTLDPEGHNTLNPVGPEDLGLVRHLQHLGE